MFYFLLRRVLKRLDELDHEQSERYKYPPNGFMRYPDREVNLQFILIFSLLAPPVIVLVIASILQLSMQVTFILLGLVVADMIIGLIVTLVNRFKNRSTGKR